MCPLKLYFKWSNEMKNKNKARDQKQVSIQSQTGILNTQEQDYSIWLIGFALLLTLIAYIPSFSAEFVNWDDQDYVSNNQVVKNIFDFGKFFTTTVQGNYHPLTMISLAINHAISGEDPFSYHLFNVIFHLINVLLVFKFILKLSNGNTFIAFTTAIWFGVHPMHVESVAWVSERKDVLYTLFFLLGLMSYLNYIQDHSRKQYIYTFIWFILSLASKPAAIIFPAVLFVLDYYRKRPFSISIITEKIPLFVFSAILVYITLKHQTAAGATPMSEVYGFAKRMFFPFYGYMMYLSRLVLPIHIAAFYPFPPINEELSKSYLLSPLVFLITLIICIRTWRSHREVTFGFGFYFINLVLVLQFFIVGSAIIADRYTYVPYIGLFFLIGWFIHQVLKLKVTTAYTLVGVISIVFCFMSYNQAGAWKNTAALWDNAIENYVSAKALTNRAYLFQQEKQFDKAIEYYNRSLKLNVIDKEVYLNLGSIYFQQNKDSLSLMHYNEALRLKPDYLDALNGRGALYAKQGKSDLALADFNKVHELNPNYEQAYKNKAAAFFQDKKYDLAINEYKAYLNIQKNDAEAFANLGVSYLNKGSNQEAIEACEQAVKLDPKYAGAYTNMGAAYINLKQYPKALEYLNTSFKLDSTNEDNLKFLSLTYLNMGDTVKALSIFEYANKLKGQ